MLPAFWNSDFFEIYFFHRLRLEDEGDLVIQNVSDEDEGKYQCLAKNIVGTRSTDKAELFVQGKFNKNYSTVTVERISKHKG